MGFWVQIHRLFKLLGEDHSGRHDQFRASGDQLQLEMNMQRVYIYIYSVYVCVYLNYDINIYK